MSDPQQVNSSGDEDEENSAQMDISDAVQKVTVKALQELSLDDMSSVQSGQQTPEISAAGGTCGETGRSQQDENTSRLLRDLGEGLGYEEGEGATEDYTDYESNYTQRQTRDEGGDVQPDLVVLDPDHPLMKRFQNALKAHLQKQIQRTKLAHREMNLAVKRKMREREDLGVRMYGLQQELAKQQSDLEEVHDKRNMVIEKRQNKEHVLNSTRDDYKENKELLNNENKRNAELQTEVDNLTTRLFHMSNAKSDVRSDIAVMKRAAERADEDVAHLETFKKRQDLYVDRLQTQVNKLREDIALYEAQQTSQAAETLAAKHQLAEAEDEVEAIKIEKKQLYQQWNSSLVGMKRRDEAHAAMQEALKLARQQVKSLETEINGYKKSTQKEEMKNETLTIMLHKAQNERQMMKKAIQTCIEKQDELKKEYSTYSRTLHETEQHYNKAQMEKSLKQSELTVLRKQIEREYAEKVELEDKIMKEMQLQLTAVKAQQYTVRITQELRAQKKSLETDLANVENECARSALQHTEISSRTRDLKRQIAQLDQEINAKNIMIDKVSQDSSRCNRLIERKQQTIDALSKKISAVLESLGGDEVSPQELVINSLNKEIGVINESIIEQQQHWLRQQQELVKMSRNRDQHAVTINTMKKSQSVLIQTKIRIENEIEYEQNELQQLEKKKNSMRNALVRLNAKLVKENKLSVDLEQGNSVTEMQYIAELKDAEMESIKAQEKLQFLVNEKERLLKDLIDSERGIMLWEKKAQLARETKEAINTGVGQEEMNAMRAEIHRMQVRYSQLMKLQEQMIREMEQSVTRRDFISFQGEAVNTKNNIAKKRVTMGTFQKKLIELQKKIKNTQKDVKTSDDDIRQLRENQAELGKSLEEKQKVVHDLQEKLDQLSGDIESLFDTKQRNLNEIIAKQTKVKYLMSLKDDKYTTFCKSEQSLKVETDKQEDRFHHTVNILDRIGQEFPHSRQALRRITAQFTQPETN